MYKPRRCDACGALMEADSRKCEYCQTCYEYIGPAVPRTVVYEPYCIPIATTTSTTNGSTAIGYTYYNTIADAMQRG